MAVVADVVRAGVNVRFLAGCLWWRQGRFVALQILRKHLRGIRLPLVKPIGDVRAVQGREAELDLAAQPVQVFRQGPASPCGLGRRRPLSG